MKRTLSITLLFLFMACMSPATAMAKKAPDWIDGTSNKYSEPRYFIGVGAASLDRGGSKQQHEWAGDRARAEIAKIIKSEVRVKSRSERDTEGIDKDKRKKSWEGRSIYRESVSVSAREVLGGVEIKSYYQDKKQKTLYALAVLDRYKAAKVLEKGIKDIKTDVIDEMEAGNSLSQMGSLLPALGHYKEALNLTGSAMKQNEVLSVLKPAGVSSFADVSSYKSDLKRLISETKKHIGFKVSIEGPASRIKYYVDNGLSKAGIVSKGKGSSATHEYAIDGITDLTYKGTIDMGKHMNMHVYQASIDMTVNDPETNVTLGTLMYSANGNAKTEGMAKKSAERALGELVQKKIGQEIMDIR